MPWMMVGDWGNQHEAFVDENGNVVYGARRATRKVSEFDGYDDQLHEEVAVDQDGNVLRG